MSYRSANRHDILAALCALACGCLLALLAARGLLRYPDGTSSYAALAEAFLHGRLDVAACPELDCANFDAKTFIVFPPLPAILLMPVVAFTGAAGFKGGLWLGMAMAGLTIWLWDRIFRQLDVPASTRIWLLVAIAFASPVYMILFLMPGVWFMAQMLAFLLCTLAVACVILWRSLPLAGVCIALALHCRQMAIFLPLFLFGLALRQENSIFHPKWNTVRTVLIAIVPIAISIAIMLAYNYARFGNPLDTGYAHIANPDIDNPITRRAAETGFFSFKYALFNFYYLLLQGFHVEFAGQHMLTPSAVDPFGTAILVASPWLFLLFYSKLDRTAAFGFATIVLIAGVTLFYHSNGYLQINTQRYALDWMPVALVLIVRQREQNVFHALPPLATFGVMLNLAAFGTRVLFL